MTYDLLRNLAGRTLAGDDLRGFLAEVDEADPDVEVPVVEPAPDPAQQTADAARISQLEAQLAESQRQQQSTVAPAEVDPAAAARQGGTAPAPAGSGITIGGSGSGVADSSTSSPAAGRTPGSLG